MGFERRFRRNREREKRIPKEEARAELEPSMGYPDDSEAAFNADFAEASAQARKHLLDFLRSRRQPLLWIVGPGIPGRETSELIQNFQGTVHVVDVYSHVLDHLRRQLRKYSNISFHQPQFLMPTYRPPTPLYFTTSHITCLKNNNVN